MFNDILGDPERETTEKERAKNTQNKINLIEDHTCYECGETFDNCECEEFGLDIADDIDELLNKPSPCSDDCDCDNDGGCMGVGVLKDGGNSDPWNTDISDIEPSQDINT